MNIAILHTDFRIYWPFRLRSLQNYLKEKGINLFIVEIAGKGSPYSFEKSKANNVDNWNILFPDKKIEELDSKTIKHSLLQILDELKPEVVIAGAIAFFSGAIATIWSVKNNKKLIIFDDAKLENVNRNFIIDWIKKNIYKNVNAVFCPAPEWDETFRYFGFEKEQIFYGVNVVDNDFWSEKDSDIFEIELPEKFFLSVGRMIPRKNFINLLAAYKEYKSKVDDPLSLIIVGDGPERNNIKKFLENSTLTNWVHLFPFQSQERLRKFYQKAKFFVLASKNEPWGLVVNEAMAAGLPVLVSNEVGCAKTLVAEGENGFNFSPEKSVELANILIKLHSISDDQLKEMGKHSQKIIANWSIERFNSGLYEAIQFALKNDNIKRSFISKTIANFWKGRYRPA